MIVYPLEYILGDEMKRYGLVGLTVVIVVVAAFRFSPRKIPTVSAQDNFGTCVSQVPETWGQFKGGSEQTGIAFEDMHGTIRFVTSFPCNGSTPPVALMVKRIPGS